MRNSMLTVFLISGMLFSCKSDCEPGPDPACADAVPVGELCQAYFQRWFFSTETKSCSQISYSGCSQKGFATKAECEACTCN